MSSNITTSKILKINIDIDYGYAKIELDSDQSSVERDLNQLGELGKRVSSYFGYILPRN